ncbi:MAG: hypothetical protein WA705_26295 [Candidatus Ozemobacteraceae bacterium]
MVSNATLKKSFNADDTNRLSDLELLRVDFPVFSNIDCRFNKCYNLSSVVLQVFKVIKEDDMSKGPEGLVSGGMN